MTNDTLAKLAADIEAFSQAMIAAGHLPPALNTRGDGFTYERDHDRFVGWTLRAAQALPAAGPTRPANSQDWAGMDGATAFQLIERHADGWADIALMMGEWLAANQAAQQAAQAVRLDAAERRRHEQFQQYESDRARWSVYLERLGQAERDAGRYAWTLHHLGLIEAHATKWNPAKHRPLLAYVQDFIDASIASEAKP